MKQGIVILIAFIVVALSAKYPLLMLNPGDLTDGHQKIRDDCTACHKLFWGIESNKCIDCHKPEEIDKKAASNESVDGKKTVIFHDKLKNAECAACHSDHNGIHGQVSPVKFEHDLLSDDLKSNCSGCHSRPTDNLHDKFTASCGSCHSNNDWKLQGAFDHNKIMEADRSNCMLCHQKPADFLHQTLKENCDKCHNTQKWSPATFDHTSYFILDKDHNVKCITCHTESNFKNYTCYGCHEHTESNMINKHSEEGITDISGCASCHRSGDEHDIKNRDKINSNDKSEGRRNLESGKQEKDSKKDDHKKNEEEDD